jgi:hypothetical protein
MSTVKKPRCPKGTRRNKAGDCVPVAADAMSIAATSVAATSVGRTKGTRRSKSRSRSSSSIASTASVSGEISTKSLKAIAAELLQQSPEIKVSAKAYTAVSNAIHSKSPAELRQINDTNELMMPFERYPDDKSLLMYLAREILDVAINKTRDSGAKTVNDTHVNSVLRGTWADDQLRELFE